MKTIAKISMVALCAGLFLGLAVLGVSIKIETRPVAVEADTQVQPLNAILGTFHAIYSAGDFACRYDLGVNGTNQPTAVLNGAIKSEVPSGAGDCGTAYLEDLGAETDTIDGLTAQWSEGDQACIYTCPQDYALVAVVAEYTPTAADCNNYACRYIGSGGPRISLQSAWNSGDHSCDYTCPTGYGLQGFVGENPVGASDCNSFGDGCQKIVTQATPMIECSTNSDCPASGFTGSLTCQNNDPYQNYRTYTCLNPGTASAVCDEDNVSTKKEMCAGAQGCDSGGCFPQTW